MNIVKLSAAMAFTVLVVAGCNKKQKQATPPAAVTVAPAIDGYVIGSREIIGQTKAYDSVNLVARVKGFLRKQNFSEGHMVKKGQMLFQIEKDEYQASLESAQAQLKQYQAKLMNANIEYDRQKKLLKESATSKRTYDDALSDKMVAEANVLNAKASLDNAKINLGYTDIKSPFDGRIGLVTYSVGNVVGPDSEKLANVVRLDPMRVEFNVNEIDILKLNLQAEAKKRRQSDKLIVKLKFQDGTIYQNIGRIEFASNKVNSGTGTLLVQAVFPNKEEVLVPGMFVKVLLIDPHKISAILIPRQATMEDQSGEYVMVVGADNKVERKNIKTGLTSGPNVQVKEGLKAGEKVIIEGLQKVRAGSKVTCKVDASYSKEQKQLENAADPNLAEDPGAESPTPTASSGKNGKSGK